MRLSDPSSRAASCRSKIQSSCFVRPATVLVAGALVAVSMCPPVEAGVLSRLRGAISSLWGDRAEKKHSASGARSQAASLNHKSAVVHERLEDTQRALLRATSIHDNLSHQLRTTEAKIVTTRHRVQIATRQYDAHLKLLGQRLAARQRTGRLSYVQLMLNARSLNDLARRAYYFNAVATRDGDLQEQLKADRLEMQRANNLLMAQWAQRRLLARAANRERVRIVTAASEQRATLRELNANRYALLSYAEAQEQSAREIEAMIGSLSARRSAILQSRNSDSRGAYSSSRRTSRIRSVSPLSAPGGRLRPMGIQEIAYHDTMRPLDSSRGSLRENFATSQDSDEHAGHNHSGNGYVLPVRGRLSSRFGMRYHPVLQRTKLHTGDDLAARQGTPFRAARSGKVLWSGWKKAYGNTVIVDHGDGVATLYGHASKLSVRAGQSVKAGDYIGNVGSTGWSTGPHLHFEVRKNGKPVNPKAYLRGR